MRRTIARATSRKGPEYGPTNRRGLAPPVDRRDQLLAELADLVLLLLERRARGHLEGEGPADGAGEAELGELLHLVGRELLGQRDQAVEGLQFSPNGEWLAYYVGGMLHVERVSNLLQEKDDSEAPPQNISIGMHLKSRVLGILSK